MGWWGLGESFCGKLQLGARRDARSCLLRRVFSCLPPAHRPARAARGTWGAPNLPLRRHRRRGSPLRPAWAAPSTCPTHRPPPPPSTTPAPRCPPLRAGVPRSAPHPEARPPNCSEEARLPRVPPTPPPPPPAPAARRPSSHPAAWPSPTAPARPSTSWCPLPACPRSA